MPSVQTAGNVLRSHTTLRLSFRLPPTLDAASVGPLLKELIEKSPVPYGAEVEFVVDKAQKGWNAKELDPWIYNALDKASESVYGAGNGVRLTGEGGSIPFLGK